MATHNQPKTLKKARSSIFDLFSRPKVERAHGNREATPNVPVRPSNRDNPLPPLPPTIPVEHLAVDSVRPSVRATRSVQSFRPASRLPSQQRPRREPTFEPPPLFQAYPQAISHKILEAPGSSHGPTAQDGETEVGEEPVHVDERKLGSAQSVFERLKSRRKSKHPQLQQDPNVVPTPSWSQKIYILVTTGHLLQYSAHGSYDRLPEQMLKLSKDSAAFASDAIEGKHWVLQVIQDTKGGSINQPAPKTFLSKVGLQGHRRIVSSMLLVFGAPEDMDKWIAVIRREVERLGGSKPTAPYDETKDEEKSERSHDQQSALHRRLSGIVRKPSSRTTQPLSPISTVTDTSTVVASSRSSNLTAVGSPRSLSTRSSKAHLPALLSPQLDGGSLYTDDGYGPVIGPALNSPGFFEQGPSPMRFDFPHSPSARSFTSSGSGTKGNGRAPLFPVPDIPAYYASPPAGISPGSVYSDTDKTPPTSDAPIYRPQENTDLSRSSEASSISHPMPTLSHDTTSSEPTGSDTSSENYDRPVSISTWPAPPQPQLNATQAPSLTLSMDSISESPPPTPGIPVPPRSTRRPTPLKLANEAPTSTSIYTRRSSLAPPGEGSLARSASSGTRAANSKRNSVFNKPLPLKVSPPQSNRESVQQGPTPPNSNRVSLQQRSLTTQSNRGSIQQKPTPPQSNRVSVQQGQSYTSVASTSTASSSAITWSPCASPSAPYFTPPSTAGLSPMPTAALLSNSEEKLFNRPPSISTYQALAANHPLSYPAPDTRARRVSTQVPIIRPPIRSSMLRTRAGAAASGKTMHLPPPPNPPPNAPLPATPSQTRSPSPPPLAAPIAA